MAFIGLSVPPSVGDLFEQVVVPGNRESKDWFHLTLVNLGKEVPIEQIGKAAIVAYGVCATTRPFQVSSKLVTSFPAGHDGVPIIARVESPGLHELQAALRAALDGAGISYSKKFPEFKPHVTLAYSDPATDMPDQPLKMPISWTVSDVVLWAGDRGARRMVVKFPLELGQPMYVAAHMGGRMHRDLLALRVAARHQIACGPKCSTCQGECSCSSIEEELPTLGPHQA